MKAAMREEESPFLYVYFKAFSSKKITSNLLSTALLGLNLISYSPFTFSFFILKCTYFPVKMP